MADMSKKAPRVVEMFEWARNYHPPCDLENKEKEHSQMTSEDSTSGQRLAQRLRTFSEISAKLHQYRDTLVRLRSSMEP